jgi:hypothetical protein
VDGTALAGEDYTQVSGTLIFAEGETSKTVSVPVINDNVFEGPENFGLVLSNPTGNNINLTYPSTASVQISDSENQPSITAGNLSLAEPVRGATSDAVFTVRLTNPTTQTVTVSYATADGTATSGSDYTGVNGTLTFAPLETTKTVSVQILGDDNAEEPDENFFLNLSGAINATINSSPIRATIVNYNPQTARHVPFDFDGDGRSDVSVFRPSDSTWHLNRSQAGYAVLPFGLSTDGRHSASGRLRRRRFCRPRRLAAVRQGLVYLEFIVRRNDVSIRALDRQAGSRRLRRRLAGRPGRLSRRHLVCSGKLDRIYLRPVRNRLG